MRGPKRTATVDQEKLNPYTKKKTKVDKDSCAPKRPPTAFFLFMKQFRKDNKENIPDNNIVSVEKECGVKWKAMSDSEKAPYLAKAARKKAEYEIAIKQHNDDFNESAKDESAATSLSSEHSLACRL